MDIIYKNFILNKFSNNIAEALEIINDDVVLLMGYFVKVFFVSGRLFCTIFGLRNYITTHRFSKWFLVSGLIIFDILVTKKQEPKIVQYKVLFNPMVINFDDHFWFFWWAKFWTYRIYPDSKVVGSEAWNYSRGGLFCNFSNPKLYKISLIVWWLFVGISHPTKNNPDPRDKNPEIEKNPESQEFKSRDL